jgi:CRISPR/Cas system CMR subunit Cmr4 (Cas7 group RAMP superfamily)
MQLNVSRDKRVVVLESSSQPFSSGTCSQPVHTRQKHSDMSKKHASQPAKRMRIMDDDIESDSSQEYACTSQRISKVFSSSSLWIDEYQPENIVRDASIFS